MLYLPINCKNMAKQLQIAYYRVSSKKQGSSGLGLESQKILVFDYLK